MSYLYFLERETMASAFCWVQWGSLRLHLWPGCKQNHLRTYICRNCRDACSAQFNITTLYSQRPLNAVSLKTLIEKNITLKTLKNQWFPVIFRHKLTVKSISNSLPGWSQHSIDVVIWCILFCCGKNNTFILLFLVTWCISKSHMQTLWNSEILIQSYRGSLTSPQHVW